MERPGRAAGVAGIVLLAAVALAGATIGLGDAGDEAPARETAVPEAVEGSPSPSAPSEPATPSGPELLLPNMRSLDASDLQIEVVGDVRRLRFAASLANTGAEPLLLMPGADAGCPAGQHSAQQLLHADADDDGEFQRGQDSVAERRSVGCMLDHPTHDHWHFDGMAAYSLRRPGSEEVVVSRDKVSFCLRDNEKVAGQPVVVPREYFGDCTADGPQGISPGWVDVYTADLDGQWLRLPGDVRSEALCLDLEADPLDVLLEADETDNGASIGIEVSGTSVQRADDVACG